MNDIEDRIKQALEPYKLDDRFFPGSRGTSKKAPRRRKRALSALAVAASLALVVLLVTTLLPVWAPGGPDPAVAALMHRFAVIAQHAPAEAAPLPGQYLFTQTRSVESFVHVSGDNKYRFVYSVPVTSQRWLGLDGSGRDVSTTGHPTFPTQSDKSAYEAYMASGDATADKWGSDWGQTATEVYGAGQLGWRDTSGLPTDPKQLGSLIDRRQIVDGPSGDWESFALATDLIRDSYSRPALRAALYSYMAGLSGIELLGNTVDALGRPGVALASSHDGMRYEVVFDPKNGKILEERDVVETPDQRVYQNGGPGDYAYAAAGQPVYVGTYERFGEVVGSTSQVPARR